MATDVTKASKTDYWVELVRPEPPAKGTKPAAAMTDLVFDVRAWKEAAALARGKSLKATLTLIDVDSREQAAHAKTKGKDTPFAKLELALTKTDAGIAARVTNPVVDRSLKGFAVAQKMADFTVRVGSQVLYYRPAHGDWLDETADGVLEVGFTFEEGDRIYQGTPPHAEPAFVVVENALERMLGLKDRFSDPGRKPSLSTEKAPKELQKATLDAIAKGQGDIDIDGLRFDALLDGTMTRRELIESMWKADGVAYTCKTRALFKGKKDPSLDAKHDVVDVEWGTGDIKKAYFVIHDFGILDNNRVELRYQPQDPYIRTVAVHGFMNWGGVYATGWDLYHARHGTVLAFKPTFKEWSNFTVEVEHASLPYYRPGPSDPAALEELLTKPPGQQTYAHLPQRLEKNADWTQAAAAHDLACLTWKLPIGWDQRVAASQRGCKPTPNAKEKEVPFFVAGAPVELIHGIADLYLLASARAGHLLTITTHYEIDRTIHGHDDPSGIDLRPLYEAITERISKGGARRLAGLGALKIPAGVRYGMHPLRLSSEPVQWKPDGWTRAVPLSRLWSGSGRVEFTTHFPQQSTPPTIKPPKTPAPPPKKGR